MKRFALVGLLLVGGSAHAEHTRVSHPNVFGLELMGRGLAYAIFYDRVMNDDLVAGFGFGTAGTKLIPGGADSGRSATVIPAYVNYYFAREQGSFFATGGATIVANASSVNGTESKIGGLDFTSSAVLPSIGAGYENRGDSGFLFRFGAYALIGDTVAPWMGFSFGYAF